MLDLSPFSPAPRRRSRLHAASSLPWLCCWGAWLSLGCAAADGESRPTSGSGGASNGGASNGGATSTSTGGKANTGGTTASSNGGSTTGGGTTSGGAASGGSATSGGAAGTCPGFVFCDDFEDGNSSGWIATPSAFSVADDGTKIFKQQATGEAWAYAGSIAWTDVTIQARVKVVSFGGTSSSICGGLIARWQGSSTPNYQASLCANGTIGIYKDGNLIDETNGTKAAGIVANTWYSLKFKVSGKPGSVNLTLSLNDTPALSVTDSDGDPVAAGYLGIGSKKAMTIVYDDIKVSTP